MTGPQHLTIAIIIVFVIAFIITMIVLNSYVKNMLSSNSRLVDNQNALLEQNKKQEKDKTELKKRINELEEELKNQTRGEVAQLKEQTREYRENIELTADMNDEDLMVWIDQKMDETRLYIDNNLTLKTLANALGLTQRRLGSLFKSHPKYASLGDYLNEKRILLACKLLREKPNWTIEAIGTEAGFGSRRTFQMEMKHRFGITPLQYRQGMETTTYQETPQTSN
jgi:AraC-like DNA-binding protein